MATTSVVFTHGRASDLQVRTGDPARIVLNKVVRLFEGGMAGAYSGATGFVLGTGPATGTVTLASADDVEVTVAGYTVGPVPAEATDDLTAVEVATAINTEPGLSALVEASTSGDVVTITSLVGGAAGNALLLSSTAGTGTATASGANLTGGTSTSYTF
jgi:phage tail sheath gpL-like